MKNSDTKNTNPNQNSERFDQLKENTTNSNFSELELLSKIYELELHQKKLEQQNEELLRRNDLLENSAKKHSELYEFAPTAYFTLSKTGEIIDTNTSGYQLLDLTKSEVRNKNFIHFVSEDTAQIFRTFLENLFISQNTEICELKLTIPNNLPLLTQISASYNRNSDQCLLTITPIDEVKKSAELNQTLLSSLPYPAMYIRRSDRVIISANHSATEMGIEVGGHCWHVFGKLENNNNNEKQHINHSTNLDIAENENKCSFCEAENCFQESVVKKKTEISALGKIWEIYWIKVNDEVFLHYAIDISENKQTQEEREFLLSSVENSSIIVVVKDLDLRVVAANKNYLDITGYKSLKNIIGKNDAEIFRMSPNQDPVRTYIEDDKQVQQLMKGEYLQKEEKFKLQNGKIRTLLTKKYPIFNKAGKLFCIGSVSLDITERKKVVEALQKSEQMLQNILEHFPGEVFWKDKESRYLGCNKSFAKGMGYNNKLHIINKTDFDFLRCSKRAEIYRKDDFRIMESGEGKLHRIEMKRHKNGLVRWFDTNKLPLRDSKGNIIGIMGVFTDITDRKFAEETLLKSEEKYRGIIENSHYLTFICNPKGILTYISNACNKSLGLTEEQIIGKSFLHYIDSNDVQKFKEWMDKVLHSDNQFVEGIEYRLKHKNGESYWHSTNGSAIKDKNGKIKGFECTANNIQERKLAELKLRESEKNYRYLFANNPQPMWIIEYETEKFLEVNNSAIKHYGYSKEEFQTMTLRNIQIHRNTLAPHKKLNTKKNEYHLSLEEKHITKKGKIIFVEITSHAVKYDEKNARHVLVNDITKRKLAEENLKLLNEKLEDRVKERTSELLNSNISLKLAEEKFRTVADFTYGWEYWINDEGNILYMSPSAKKMTGYTVDEFINCPKLIDNIVFENDKDNWELHKKNIYSNKKRKKHTEIIYRIEKKSGDIRWISSVFRTISINGKYMGMRVSNLNITQKVKTENELLKVTVNVEERERNRFSRELHDGMGPLLSTIKLYFQWLSETDDPEKIKIITQKGNANIESAIQSSREIARGLSTQNLKKFGYVDTITDFTQRLNDTKKITIKFKSNTDERFDNFLETTLYRISTELIKNTISYAKATLVNIDFNFNKEKKIIHLSYSDNGVGFNFADIEKDNKGMGVMNIQQRIKSLRGKFKIKTQIGKGMKVLIEFPIDII